MKKEITKKLLLNVLDQELKWCRKYFENRNELQEGFIKGLLQAKFLIKKL